MSNTHKLQYIYLCSKMTQELENHIGMRDKDLAEFIIELGKQSDTLEEFKNKLDENDGEFPQQLIEIMFRLIKKTLPGQKPKLKGDSENQQIEKAKKVEQQLGKYNVFADEDENQLQDQDQNISEFEKSKQDQEYEKKKNQHLAKFPGLALQNDKKKHLGEEIDLNIDLNDKIHIEDENDNDNQNKDKDRKSKRSKKSRSRSRSRDRKKKHKRSSSRDRKRNKQYRSRSKSQEKHQIRELIQGEIYPGVVKSVKDYGAFVQILGIKQRKEGLVHISDISQERISNAFQALQVNQNVFIKVVLIVNEKIKLNMKEVDQRTGQPLEKKVPMYAAESNQKVDNETFLKPITVNGKPFGSITGISLTTQEEEQKQKKSRKRESSQEKWEDQQTKYWSKLGNSEKNVNIEDSMSDEDEVNIELGDKEAPFLQGQTTKSGVLLSPVRIIKNPEGSLNREAMNAAQFAKDRREIRQQQDKQQMENVDKEQLQKFWDDPSAPNRALSAQIRTLNQSAQDVPDYKKEAMFRQGKAVNKSLLTIKQQKEQLPIFLKKATLIKAVKDNRVLVVIGETGSGKTTQMTQYLLEAGFAKKGKKIGCTQPRKVAATSIAKRVSEEMGCVLGEEVGFTIRFEDCTSKNTLIKYMTDGMLLREALVDPDLEQYSVIMLDEAHERNLNTDILFGILKKIVARRKDFTLIVTSATLDAGKFSEYFYDAKILRIPGRTFPVEIHYSIEPEEDYLDASLLVVMQIHLNEPPGDILLFLTGQEEIDNACQTLFERMKRLGPDAPELIICPVYAALPSDQQNKIFSPAPEGSRKVVIATNIAEASLTIDGIFYVIDPGFSKVKMFNPKLGMDSLQIAPISQASARQRAGRAGRTGPGKCYRLYTEEAYYNEMLPSSVPEIQRTNLANTILLLKAMGINDLLNFDFMDPPPVQSMIAALEMLYNLGALDDDGLLTKLGMKIAEFPLDPPLGKMLLTSVDLQCAEEICTIIAMLTVQTVFDRPKEKAQQADQKRSKFLHPDGDHLTLLTVYEAWKNNNYSNIWCSENFIQPRSMRNAQDIKKQIMGILERYRLPVTSAGRNTAKIRKAITSGFFFHAAKKDPQEGYKTLLDNHTVYIHPSSALFNRPPEWVLYNELILTSKEYMRNVTTIDPKWLIDVAPNFYSFSSSQALNSRKRQEKLEPLSVKYGGDKNAWRLSRR